MGALRFTLKVVGKNTQHPLTHPRVRKISARCVMRKHHEQEYTV